MSTQTMALVLVAALLHAGWNALIRSSADRALDAALVAGGAGVAAAVALPFLAAPAPAALGFMLASGVIHVVYMLLVGAVYARGEMSVAYPLMRGAAPLMTALGGALLVGERLSALGWAGVAATSGGVLGLAAAAARRGGASAGLPLLNAAVIASYTLVDGTGARVSGAPVAYTLWTLLLGGAPVVLIALRRRGAAFLRHARGRWGKGLLGGTANAGAYALVLHAMTQAPIAAVAALRESSIVFAMAISTFVLRERPTRARLAAAFAVALGAILLRLS
ncbi:EamA family transporter [Methylocella sp.]|uniref:EamA family transporter n=1 Tax=Methylocella sp. TaxID=1978226 RepID=UPI00378386CF